MKCVILTLIPVNSGTAVDWVGCDEERRLLQVMFTGGWVYRYAEVSPEVLQGLTGAKSKGQNTPVCAIDAYPCRCRPCQK
ncbi:MULTISPECIES: KTSC domain-containing protein [Caldilinea]|jgi:hypothetical protein|uniref:KTSC domain-containing protein n=1 Tax=Caldilinea aerophila (strain DSM 14535 / JCM 11387 / NBRC 104270 / STL-6-O1) TaxID=926550 RepID=I0I3A9_CALAS|nr:MULTISPECIES: KTSC domain-containing protein [Caldilinea]MBO9394036.1 KTSC domain-containing protein [Caldilinea sp.]BAL99746.1 hypothetical protein CLDAP_17070 [Caldilinea aerophila DSM 14535 = NBRC 104270]